jgi:Flp pilus assembly protein TadB
MISWNRYPQEPSGGSDSPRTSKANGPAQTRRTPGRGEQQPRHTNDARRSADAERCEHGETSADAQVRHSPTRRPQSSTTIREASSTNPGWPSNLAWLHSDARLADDMSTRTRWFLTTLAAVLVLAVLLSGQSWVPQIAPFAVILMWVAFLPVMWGRHKDKY